ncbi:MAG: dephospho-CoA kinase [Ectothiorhodospiraceae bacterium AqS1]|nr:dephospho-CoA kinase [Ectothiorhodospiraceae bacterium AqS1]
MPLSPTTESEPSERPLIVALTGGIASGKSAVARRFEARGTPVIDADDVARDLVAPGSPALSKIVRRFGEEVLDSEGGLDRARMRKRIFDAPADRRTLEAILHPEVRKAMHDFAASKAGSPYVLFVIPLLVETGQAKEMDKVIVVDAPRSLRIERAISRDGSPGKTIEAIIDSQSDRESLLAVADIVIENIGDMEALESEVEKAHRDCLCLAAKRKAEKDRALGHPRE